MRYFSMFSGIGGFELGIQRVCEKRKEVSGGSPEDRDSEGQSEQLSGQSDREGLSCVGFSEIDKYAIEVYKKHFPTHKEYGNAEDIHWNDVEDFDLLGCGHDSKNYS